MNNPYAAAQVVLKDGSPLTDLRFGTSNSRALDSTSGEFNAYDKKELVRALSQLMTSVSNGEIRAKNAQEKAADVELRREVVVAAYADAQKWASLGADLAVQIQEQRNREGFLRRIAVGQDLKQGQLPRVTVPMWDAMAVVATGPANVEFQLIRNKQFLPSEFEVVANLRCDRLEMEQVGGDILDNLYNQGLDSVMVKEDKLWKASADLTVGVVNPLNYIGGQLTPQILATIRQGVTDWNLPASTALISNDFWADIIGNADFAQMLDPVTKYDLAMNGELGTLVGLNLLTDGFRQPNQKVLNRGEIYVVSTPEHHGCFSDRGGVRSEPTTGADMGNTTRGWLMSELLSWTLANPRSVSKGRRV